MRHTWKEQDISKAFRKMAKSSVGPEIYERAWFKIEERASSRGRPVWRSIVWKPWGHPVRWVAAMVCLVAASAGFIYDQSISDQQEIASYVIAVSDPAGNITNDTGIVKVSRLLSEPSVPRFDLMEDVHVDPAPEDQILL